MGRRAQALKERIVQLALAHGIVTPYTSFVVVEERTGERRASGQPETRVVPVNAPAGWAMFGTAKQEEAEGAAPRCLWRHGGGAALARSAMPSKPAKPSVRGRPRGCTAAQWPLVPAPGGPPPAASFAPPAPARAAPARQEAAKKKGGFLGGLFKDKAPAPAEPEAPGAVMDSMELR